MSVNDFHPCEKPGCDNTVPFDDEPYCFTHSPESGSYVPGYSYRAAHKSNHKCVNGEDHDFHYDIDTDQMEECLNCGLPYSEWTTEEV